MRSTITRIHTLFLTLLLACLGHQLHAQDSTFYGASPFQDSLWSINLNTGAVITRLAPSISGGTITGMNGLAYDPCEHQTYGIAKVSGVSGRVLVTIDLTTGVCTQVGNLGDNFSSLAFRSDGQLFGLTGDGANVSESMFLIDKSNATTTLARALGNGNDGEVFVYSYDNNAFYHFSGNGTIVFEKVEATAPYNITSIPIIGSTSGEIFGGMYVGNGQMILSSINSDNRRADTLGNFSNGFNSFPDDLRGLVMPPRFSISDDTICQRTGSVSFSFGGITPDTVIYAWGDGTADTLFPAGPASHTYQNAGNLTAHVILSNACNPADTVWSGPIRVANAPQVALTPGDTTVCDTNALLITGSSGGSSQWYVNGQLIPGANSNSFTAVLPGVYNLVKTNQNGCSDSAAVGTSVLFGTTPTLTLGEDSLLCNGITLCIGTTAQPDVTYMWNTGATTDSICVSASGLYILTASDSIGCTITDTLEIIAKSTPSPVVSIDSSACPTISFSTIGTSESTFFDWAFGDGGTSNAASPSHTYAANGTYNLSLSTGNECGNIAVHTTINITCVVGIQDGIQGQVQVFPVPAQDHVALNMTLDQPQTVSYRLVDIMGKEVLHHQFPTPLQTLNHTLALDLPAGTYFLHLQADDQHQSFKILKQ